MNRHASIQVLTIHVLAGQAFGLEPDEIWEDTREVRICWPRMVARYLCLRHAGVKRHELAKLLALHPETVAHDRRAVCSAMSIYPKDKQRIEELEQQIRRELNLSNAANGADAPVVQPFFESSGS